MKNVCCDKVEQKSSRGDIKVGCSKMLDDDDNDDDNDY